jgi:hypothetical protein
MSAVRHLPTGPASRRPARLAAGLATGLAIGLSAGLLSGCGGDPYAGYCDAVKSHQQSLSKTLDAGGQQALLKALPIFEQLQDKAPSDVRDDWKTLTGALRRLQDAVDAAGVDPATYDAAKPPAGVTRAEQDRIAAAATEVGAERTQAAFTAVDQQARDVCHTALTV